METPREPAAPETQAELEQISYVRSKIEKNIRGCGPDEPPAGPVARQSARTLPTESNSPVDGGRYGATPGPSGAARRLARALGPAARTRSKGDNRFLQSADAARP